MENTKLKIYLDTSIISHLKQDDTPDKTAVTLRLWEEFKKGIYDIYVSDVTFDEIDSNKEPKRNVLVDIKNCNFRDLYIKFLFLI